jgi:hypothetical protein
MPTYTIYADTSDGYLGSESGTSYADARSAAGTVTVYEAAVTTIRVGQELDGSQYGVFLGYLSFDTSSIGDSEEVGTPVLSLYGDGDNSATDFTVEVFVYDWGATLGTGDWQGTSLGGLTKVATKATSAGWGFSYNDLTAEVAFAANINKTGDTRLVIGSSRTRGNNSPSGAEYVNFRSSDFTGTDRDPKLVVTTTLPNINIDVPAGSISLTANAPSVLTDAAVQVPAASLSLTGYAPTLLIDPIISIPAASISLTAYAPGIEIGIKVPVAGAVLAAGAPAVLVDTVVAVPAALLSAAFQAPLIATGASISVPVKSLSLTARLPGLVIDRFISVPSAGLRITTHAPTRTGPLWNPATVQSTSWSAASVDETTWTPVAPAD